MARTCSDIASRSSRILGDFVKRHGSTGQFSMDDELGIAKAFMDLAARLMADPIKLAHAHVNLWTDYMSLWQSATMKMLGHNPEPVASRPRATSASGTRLGRITFCLTISSSPTHRGPASSQCRGGVEGLDEKTRKKVNFYTRQYIDALSPANFALTNPEYSTRR